MAFIGRPNINYAAFQRQDEPSTAQAVVQALSGILATYTQKSMEEKKVAKQQAFEEKTQKAEESAALKKQGRSNSADIVSKLIGGMGMEPATSGLPPMLARDSARPSLQDMISQIMAPSGPMQPSGGAGFMSMPQTEPDMLPPPAGGMRLADIIAQIGGEPTDMARRTNVVPKSVSPDKAQAAEAKASAASAREAERGAAQNIRTEKQLRSELNMLGKDFRIVQDSYATINTIAKNAPSAAGDLSLIFSYMKLLDPGSTVREGEQATAENARGVPEQVRNIWNKVITGEKMTPEQRQDFLSQAESQYQTKREIQGQRETQYKELAKRMGVKPENVALDLGLGSAVDATPASYSKTATNPKTGEKMGLNSATGKWERIK